MEPGGHLLVTEFHETSLDALSRIIIPSQRLRELLNKTILIAPINGWSFFHLIFGALFAILLPSASAWSAFWIHNLFELGELILGEYFTKYRLLWLEGVDIAFDTLFWMIGFWLARAIFRDQP